MPVLSKLTGLAQNPRRYAWLALNMAAPNWMPINYLFMAPIFKGSHGHWPRHPSRPDASFNDYFFHRMIRNGWTDLEKRCVDKEFAKQIAKDLCPRVKTPKTIKLFDLKKVPKGDFMAEMLPLRGRRLVAKPTHGSGHVVFMKDDPAVDKIEGLYKSKSWRHFWADRQSVHIDLNPKVIVEEELPEGENTDYKFFCARGHAICCQIDVDRFSDHRRAMVTVPDFQPHDVLYSYPPPAANYKKPAQFEIMAEIASQLSKQFEFVRIDLYTASNSVYFGEFTFNPNAAMEVIRNEQDFGVLILKRIRAAQSLRV